MAKHSIPRFGAMVQLIVNVNERRIKRNRLGMPTMPHPKESALIPEYEVDSSNSSFGEVHLRSNLSLILWTNQEQRDA